MSSSYEERAKKQKALDEAARKKRFIVSEIVIALLVLSVSVPMVWQLAINVPNDVAYQNKFGAYVALAVSGPPDFQGIQQNVNTFWTNMNMTWPQSTWASTYNSWFPWDRTYDNSLVAQNQYLHHLDLRIAYYEQEINKTGATQYTDIYNQYISNLRSEIQATGNLDWVVHGAWQLQFAPLTYFFFYYMLIFELIILILTIALLIYRDGIRAPSVW